MQPHLSQSGAMPDRLPGSLQVVPCPVGLFSPLHLLHLPAGKKPPKSEPVPAPDPLMTAEAASCFLSIPALTVKRMAHRGELPSIPMPIGTTGRFRHKFRLSGLDAYFAALSRPAKLG